MKNIEIIEDYTGTGSQYRRVYKVYIDGKFACRYSSLQSAKLAYPQAIITMI